MRLAWTVAVLLSIFPSTSAVAVLTYPGSSPCDSTLQACLDGAPAGETLQLATNGPVQESLSIAKSVTVEPAPGFTPAIIGTVFIVGDATATAITLQRLLLIGWTEGNPGAGAFTLHFVDNTVILTDGIRSGLTVQSGASPPYGDVTVEAARNTIAVAGTGSFRTCDGIVVLGPFDTGTSAAIITGNEITVTGCGQGNGILVANGRQDAMTAEITGNRVFVAGTDNGIIVRNFQDEPSTLDVRVVNNVVVGDELPPGRFPGGIFVLADGQQPITAQVINNTVVGRKLSVTARTDLGASVTGAVANNIIVFPQGAGLVTVGTEPAVSNDHNLVFDNPTEDDPISFTPGPGTIMQDPAFVSSTDLRLEADSPAIDAGNTARLPAGVATDIEGNPRIVPMGGTVDIGAYENQDVLPSTTTTTTLPGGCSVGATFASITCRLDAFATDVQAGVPAGILQKKVLRLAGKAGTQLQPAAAAGNARKAKRALRKASRTLGRLVARLGSRNAQQTVDAALLAQLVARASTLQADIETLRDSLS
jgi:hypothetical protein